MNPEAVITALNTHKVRYVIVGGFAAVLQGARYITQDIDFCYARDDENFKNILQAFSELHPIIRPNPTVPFDLIALQNNTNFTLDTDAGEIDLMGYIDGLGDYAEVVKRADEFEVRGQTCQVLSLEGLIDSKSALNRRKDFQLLEELKTLNALRKQSKD
jgi:predicted nucleotidyltransferase